MKTHDNQDSQDPRKGDDDSSNSAIRITSNDCDTDSIDSAERSEAQTQYIFRGVKSGPRVKRLLMSRVQADADIDVIINTIKQYARARGVFVTHIAVLKFWKQKYPTYTLRVNIKAEDFEKCLQKGFWPSGILTRQWQSHTEHESAHNSYNG